MTSQDMQARRERADARAALRAYDRSRADGERPTMRGYEEFRSKLGDAAPSLEEIVLLFGSWGEAARDAGIRAPGRPAKGTRAEAIRSLRLVAREIGTHSGGALRLRRRDYQQLSRKRRDLVPLRAALRIFGGNWASACRAAGLAPMRQARVERGAELEQAAIEIVARGGESPARWDDLRGDLPTARRIAGAYGDWDCFLRRVRERAEKRV